MNVLQGFQGDSLKAPFGFTCLNIYTNKYPNNLKLSESQYKHNTQEEEECVLVIA